MDWFEYRRFPAEQNLSELNQLLLAHRVAHRFSEEGAEQILWLADDSMVDELDRFIELWAKGELRAELELEQQSGDTSASFWRHGAHRMLRLPLTSLFIVLGFVGYVFIDVLRSQYVFQLLAFLPPEQILQRAEFWRFVTPAFLHFSPLHIIMNGVWLWVLGEKVEPALGRGNYLILFLVTAILSNFLQFYAGQSIYFGGLSGVVYGLLGFVAVGWRCFARSELMIAPGLIIFSVVMMALGFIGALDWLSEGGIANWAHLGGFIAGCAFAALHYSWIDRGTNNVR
ncbi:rhomboid family intramembrane serine protease [Agaribacterium haliotis]|uniref:rhomboid family intramembrane serine protease n=1 Tax=Agaribacterium haliotis TaxID=2013869 RepID=UPI000BB5359C|nr:rhomboid family intramembrane serine protease [Agaribacterium haliotis]